MNNFNLKFFFLLGQGDVFMWGYGKGCGNKNKDIFFLEKVFVKRKVVEVLGGVIYSLVFLVRDLGCYYCRFFILREFNFIFL